MKVSEAVRRLLDMDQDAELFRSNDGFSSEVFYIEPTQPFCQIAYDRWQRCLADECDRKRVNGVLIV